MENVNGGLRVNFTLASTIPGNTNYIVVAGCIISNTTTNGSSVQSVACGDYNFTQLEDCCNDCVTNTDGYLFAEGPVQAGKQYYCSLFGFFNGPNDNVDTGNVLASTGIIIYFIIIIIIKIITLCIIIIIIICIKYKDSIQSD